MPIETRPKVLSVVACATALTVLAGCANVKVVRNGRVEDLGRVSIADALPNGKPPVTSREQPSEQREGSKFWPSFGSPAAVDRWAAFVAANQGRLLEDATEGSTLFAVNGDWIAASLFTARDGQLLKRLAAEGSVAVVPVYEYAMDSQGYPRARVNWSVTQRRHDMARLQLGLRVLPMADTRKMHDNIIVSALREKHPDSVEGMRQMLSGLSAHPDILLTDQMPVHFSVQAQVLYKASSAGPRPQTVALDQHFDSGKLLTYPLETLLNAKLWFMPTALALSMNLPAGQHGLMSTTLNVCAVTRVPELRRQVGVEINSERAMRQELSRLITQQTAIFNEQIRLCPGVLKQQGLVGAISSRRID